jgi:N-acetylmuramoyl-L-alanine amidase
VLIGDVKVPRVSGRYRSRGDGEQLTLEVTPEVPYEIAQDGNRLVMTFDAEALDVESLPRLDGELVTNIVATDSSVSLDITLGAGFGSFDTSSRGIRNNGVELRIDFLSAERLTDAEPSDPLTSPTGDDGGESPEAIGPLPDLRSPPTVRVVAIDAGHGGDDTGTRGAGGTLEKDITLSVTRRLREAIESRLGLRVVLTRGRDETVGLDRRAAIANNNKADIFISLHVAASVRPSVTGAEVSYLGLSEYGAEAREIAQREVQLVPVVGGGTRAIDMVQWEMAQVRYIDRSARLARIVHSELNRRIPMSAREVQEAPLRVLVGANMPAVLIEMGFISNGTDERRLASARFQEAVVDALVGSILRFRDYLERAHTDEGGAASLNARDE